MIGSRFVFLAVRLFVLDASRDGNCKELVFSVEGKPGSEFPGDSPTDWTEVELAVRRREAEVRTADDKRR